MSASARNQQREDLQQQLARVQVGLGEAGPGRAISTGVTVLDRQLPLQGLPRGQIIEMVGERGSGRTTLLVCAMAQLASQGERSAVVDLEGDLSPSAFSESGLPAGWVWVVQAGGLKEGLWAADLLIRSGHFGLVVLDGVSGFIPVSALMRLQHEARESDVALVVGTQSQEVSAPGSLKMRFRRLQVEWEAGLGSPAEPGHVRFAVQVARQGKEVPIRFACRPWRLLGRHPGIPDRKRAVWTERGG